MDETLDTPVETDSTEDIRKVFTISKTTPEEAVKNIDRANLFGIKPDTYAQYKDQLDPEADSIERTPAKIEPGIAAHIKEGGEQVAALAKDDLKSLNVIEKLMRFGSNKLAADSNRRDINEVVSEQMNAPGGILDDGQKIYLDELRYKNKEMETENTELEKEFNGATELAVDVVAAGTDMFRGYYENKALMGGIIATSSLGGLAIGAMTPVTAIVGLKLGAVKGVVGATTAVGFLDAYKQTSRGMYEELSQASSDQGENLNIPHERKLAISYGVGSLSGIAGGIAGKIFAKANPFLKNLQSPKLAVKYLMKSPANLAKMEAFGNIAKVALAEGGEEGFQEFIQTVGGIFGKMDESEASFTNAIDEALSSENLKKYVYAGTVGLATAGTIQTGVAIAGNKSRTENIDNAQKAQNYVEQLEQAPGTAKIREEADKVQKVTADKMEVLQAQNNLLEIAETMKNTKMNKLAPHELTNLNKKLMGLLGVDEKVYFHLEDLRTFADSAEKGEAVRKIIDPNGDLTKMAQELNTPVELNKAELLQVITEFPELSEYMRITPEGENPFIIRNEAKEFDGKLKEAEAKRATILDTLDTQEALTPEQLEALNAEVLAPINESKYVSTREKYLEQSTFNVAEGVMDEKTNKELSQVHLEARLELDQAIVAPVDARFDRYADAQYRNDTQEEIALETQKLSKEYSVIDNFTNIKELSEVENTNEYYERTRHKKPGFSQYAIDPKSLTEVQKALYMNDQGLFATQTRNLSKRKAFVEGGIDVEEAASLFGLDSGDQLLKILAETPTKKQIEQRIKQDPLRKPGMEDDIEESMYETKKVARDEAFAKVTNFHLREMEIMVSKNWNTVKRGLIKLMKKVPTQKELRQQAQDTIGRMTIRDLNPNRFAQGEKASQAAALKSFTDGKIEQAFENKGKAAINNELRRESMNAQDKVAKFQRFWKRMSSPSVQQELKDAGLSDVIEGFMSAYKLDGNIKNEAAQKSFNSWVKKRVADGQWVPAMPEKLQNTQGSYKDLTVEQFQVMTEMGQFMLHQAKLKNKLLKKREFQQELETMETIAEDIDKATKANYKYDPKRGEKKESRHLSVIEKFKKGTKTAASTVGSIKTIIAELDGQQINGYFHNLIGKPLKEARTGKRMEIAEIVENDKKIIEEIYGSVEAFKPILSEYVVVPEFADVENIGDGAGNVLKSDLLVMLANMGDPDGRSALTNFETRAKVKLTDQQILTALETHLSDKDAAFVQNFMINRFNRFTQRSFEMHQRTTGSVPDMVKGVPFVFKGKVYPGGYFPIRRTIVSDAQKAADLQESIQRKESELGLEDEGHFFAKMRTAEMTQQGRMKDRTGSKRPVSLKFENVFEFTEEAVHDIHFREFGLDTLNILKNPYNVENMKNVVGPEKFVNLLNGIKDVTSKTTEREGVLFAEENAFINNAIQKFHSWHAVQAIGFNLTSAAIQADSLNTLALRSGPKTYIYLAKHAARMTKELDNYEHFVKLAAEINPDIALEQDSIDNAVTKNSYDWMPVGNSFFKNYKKLGKGLQAIGELQKKVIDASFYLPREADKANKTIATLALAEQFLAGDFEGFDLARVEAMSETERAETMRSVIQQTIDLSLTASAMEDKTPLEKQKVAAIFVRYWTDRRARLNSVLAQIDKAKGSRARGENAKAVRQLLALGLTMGSSAAFISIIRNQKDSIIQRLQDVGGEDAGEDIAELAMDGAWGFLTAPIDQTLDTIPLVDSIKYQVDNEKIPGDYRNVSTPMFGVMSNIAMGAVVMRDVLRAARKMRVKKLNETQKKAILTNLGYLAGGAPTNTMFKAYQALNSNKVTKSYKGLKQDVIEFREEMNQFIELFKDDKDAQEFIEGIKEYDKTLPQLDSDVKNHLPENAKEDLKTVLSEGNWRKVNPATGAAGVYQFTEARWNELKALSPELGLTDNGRVAKDSVQQEKAFEWEMQDHTRGLLTYEINVTTTNLLGAHEYGFDNFVALYQAEDQDKLSDVLGQDKARDPAFANFETVGDAMKALSEKNAEEYVPRLKLNSVMDEAIEEVLDVEGGYVNNKKDRGGATNFGVTRRTYEKFMQMKSGSDKPYKSTLKEIKEMTLETAKEVYETMYWKEVKGDEIKSTKVAKVLLDQAINRGPQTIIKQAQKVLGIEADGNMGEDTVKALNAMDEDEFMTKFLARASASYKKIVKNDPSQKEFEKGWKKRVDKLKDKIGDN